MSIYSIDLDTFQQNFQPSSYNKSHYGEVNTPFSLIQDMLDLFPPELFQNPNLRWLDVACGSGYFMMVLYKKLMISLAKVIRGEKKRHTHIIQNMLYMCEINPDNVNTLYQLFQDKHTKPNIYSGNFLSMDFGETLTFDCILGNPPYNSQGLKKVPTNLQINKKNDGITIWHDFIKRSIQLLKPNGFLSMIIPSIWMKPDKFEMYDFFLQYKLHSLRAFTNTETKLIFKHQAQTPTCYFLLENTPNDFVVSLYNSYLKTYVPYEYSLGQPIPLCSSTIISKLKYYVHALGGSHLQVYKSNMPSKNTALNLYSNETFHFPNIHTTLLVNRIHPSLSIMYSDKPCSFSGEKKLVLAHKMYGFPYFDKHCKYGISNRDTYIIKDYTCDEDFLSVQRFLSTKLALLLYETTRYRMKYLEKYVFQFIPDIVKLIKVYPSQFPHYNDTDYDNKLYSFFGFNHDEIDEIETLHTKQYSWNFV